MKISAKKDKFIYILTLIYMIPLCLFYIANTLFSLSQTTYMELYQEVEKPLYQSDSPLFLLLLFLLFTVVFGFLLFKRPVTPNACRFLEKTALYFSVIISLLVIFIYRATVACDSAALSDIAIAFLQGDFSSLTGDGYLVHYPHQLGMISFIQFIYYIFGAENFIVLQLFNVAAIFSVIYFLHRIADELFSNSTVSALLSVLCIGALPLYLYATFIYGDIPGLGFALPAVYIMLRYLHTEKTSGEGSSTLKFSRKKLFLLVSGTACTALSIFFKSNNSVLLAAMVLILILHTIKEKDWFSILFAAALLAAPALCTAAVNTCYLKLSGAESIPDGIPKIAWVAMGLQANDYLENGWYNAYNWDTYSNCGYDASAAAKASMDSIENSIKSFISSPGTAVRFFYKKFISQWNDPCFQSQITNEWYSRHRQNHSALALSLIYGKGRDILAAFMNFYHFLVLLGASIASLISIKKFSLSQAFLMLCVFGGYFFHTFWEAGGRYALSYFLLSIPLAAYGLYRCTGLFRKLMGKCK